MLIGDTVIAVIFRELNMVVALNVELYRFFECKGFRGKPFEQRSFLLLIKIPAAVRGILVRLVI